MALTVAAIEIADDEVRLGIVRVGGFRPKVLELHVSRVASEVPYLGAIMPEGAREPEQENAAVDNRAAAVAEALRDAVQRVRARPAASVLCVPAEFSIARLLRIPFRGKRRVAAAMQFELEPFLAFPIEELAVDFIPVREIEGETEVLVIGLRKSYLKEQLAILEAAGIEADSVAVDGLGLTALWLAGARRGKGLNAVLHVREQHAVFTAVNGKTPVYFRHVPLTRREIQDSPHALVRQVQNSIHAFAANWRGQADVVALTITGVDLFEEERALIENGLGIPVRHESLFAALPGARRAHKAFLKEEAARGGAVADSDSSADVLKTNYWACVAAAAGAARGSCALNFRKAELSFGGLPRLVQRHAMFSCCLALAVLLGMGWYYYDKYERNMAEARLIQKRMDSVAAEVDKIREAGLGVPLEMFADPPFIDVLAELAQRMPDSKARITELKVARSGVANEWITVSGEVANESVFGEVLTALRESTLFRVEENPSYAMTGGKSTFSIRLMRMGDAAADETGETSNG